MGILNIKTLHGCCLYYRSNLGHRSYHLNPHSAGFVSADEQNPLMLYQNLPLQQQQRHTMLMHSWWPFTKMFSTKVGFGRPTVLRTLKSDNHYVVHLNDSTIF